MNTLNSALFLCLIQTSVLAAAVMLVRCCIPPRYAGSRAAVCGVGLTCVLAITLLTFLPLPSIWSDTVDFQQPKSVIANSAMDAPAPKSSDVLSSVPQNASPNNSSIGIPVAVSWLRHLGSGFRSAMAAVDETPRGGQMVLMLLVLGGSGIGLMRFISALRHARQTAKSSAEVCDPQTIQYLQELQRHSGCRRPISLRQTSALSAAATLGFFKPVILLPQSWQEWSHDELTAVLAHEVAHVRRGDFLHRLLGQLSAAAYFFHPLVRILVRWLAADQEFAADGLASTLHGNRQAYLHGLANLALRFHNSFSSEHAWSNVSIMPNSSDFLARRLIMLRTKDGSISRRAARWISASATVSVVIVALFTTLLHSSATLAAKPNRRPQPERVAALPDTTTGATKKQERANKPGDNQADEPLFARGAFDVSIIRHAEDGAFLVRLGDFLRNPDVQPRVDGFNAVLGFTLCELFKGVPGSETHEWLKHDGGHYLLVDFLREVEWIAGGVQATFKAPNTAHDVTDKKVGNGEGAFMLGTGSIVFRMTHSRDWQEFLFKNIPGAKLESFAGHSYVHLEPVLAVGPYGGRLRILDDKTLLFGFDPTPEEAEESNKKFFDDTPPAHPYAWTKTWRALEGGIITCVFDNSKTGASAMPAELANNSPDFTGPLMEVVKYYSFGFDCTEKGHRIGFQVRGTCLDHNGVEELCGALLALRKQIEEEIKNAKKEGLVEAFPLLSRCIPNIKIEPSAVENDQQFVHIRAEATLKEHEFAEWLENLSR